MRPFGVSDLSPDAPKSAKWQKALKRACQSWEPLGVQIATLFTVTAPEVHYYPSVMKSVRMLKARREWILLPKGFHIKRESRQAKDSQGTHYKAKTYF